MPVQELCIGELLALAPDGRLVPRPIVWIGHHSVDCRLQTRIWCGRCTFVPGHSVPTRRVAACLCRPITRFSWIRSLILVKYLINDASIERIPMDEVTYFHIELQEHSLSLAEDLPTESYLDTGDRSKVSNGAKQSTLLPDFATRMGEAAGCAPLVVTGATLDAVRRRINGCERVNVRTSQ